MREETERGDGPLDYMQPILDEPLPVEAVLSCRCVDLAVSLPPALDSAMRPSWPTEEAFNEADLAAEKVASRRKASRRT